MQDSALRKLRCIRLHPGLKVSYCTDSRPTEGIAERASGADLFICEGMYGDPENQTKAKEKKHMTMYEAAQMAQKAKVQEMWLTHYSPSLIRPDEYINQVKKIFPAAVAARDGRMTELKFMD